MANNASLFGAVYVEAAREIFPVAGRPGQISSTVDIPSCFKSSHNVVGLRILTAAPVYLKSRLKTMFFEQLKGRFTFIAKKEKQILESIVRNHAV